MAIMPRCIRLRVYPSKRDPSKRILTEICPNGTEAPCRSAQALWNEERKIQKDMGIEKFAVHVYLMQPVVDHRQDTAPRGRTLLEVEFVDSGRQYMFQTREGISQWCFRPTLGGVDYGRTVTGHDRNLDGFRPHKHSFFFDELVPVTTRTFRSLVALLGLCRPESPWSFCGTCPDPHEHHIVNIYLKNPKGDLNTVCTTHIVCGNAELEDLFHVLCCCSMGEDFHIAELDWNGNFVPGREWSYRFAESEHISVESCEWANGHIVRLLPFPYQFGPVV